MVTVSLILNWFNVDDFNIDIMESHGLLVVWYDVGCGMVPIPGLVIMCY